MLPRPLVAALLLAAPLVAGCTVDISPTFNAGETSYTFLLPPGTPLIADLFLPSFDTCELLDRDALLAQLEANGGGFLYGLFTSLVDIQNVSVIEATMTALDPSNATFDGIAEIAFLENGAPILQATAANGIDGNTIRLSTPAPVNLAEVVDQCPERESTITIRLRGNVPNPAPTRWSTAVKVRLVARLGPGLAP